MVISKVEDGGDRWARYKCEHTGFYLLLGFTPDRGTYESRVLDGSVRYSDFFLKLIRTHDN